MDILDYLLEQPDVLIIKRNLDGETALLQSIKHKSTTAAIKLIETGADTNITTRYICKSPLYHAVNNRLLDVAALLIEKGADVNAGYEYVSVTPLHLAVDTSNYEMVAMLLYYGADTDVVTVKGKTPFMMALENENVEIQELLLEYEVDFDRTDNEGKTTLQLAYHNHSPVIVDIIERGTDVNYASEMMIAALTCNSNLFKAIWSRCIYHVIYADKSYIPIVKMFDRLLRLPKKEWLKCVALVFESDAIHDVIQDYIHFENHLGIVSEAHLFGFLTQIFGPV